MLTKRCSFLSPDSGKCGGSPRAAVNYNKLVMLLDPLESGACRPSLHISHSALIAAALGPRESEMPLADSSVASQQFSSLS